MIDMLLIVLLLEVSKIYKQRIFAMSHMGLMEDFGYGNIITFKRVSS